MNVCSAAMKVILLTGSTDGIGLETAKRLLADGHKVLLHGRSSKKLKNVAKSLGHEELVETYVCDLSKLKDVQAFASKVKENHSKLDVIINNAGVFTTPNPVLTESGNMDVRLVVNTIAPYLLTTELWPILNQKGGRVVNLSSAAQAPVSLQALRGQGPRLSDNSAYAQSKLGIVMWTRVLAKRSKDLMVVAVNPASFLGSKMVKEAYGMDGKDLGIGADILVRAALSDEFQDASGKYFDNDSGRFASPHPYATNDKHCHELVSTMDELLADMGILN